jgi:hypothetical protein|tara:strand:+ start:239 stop:469 length:231 start_codon:yes stop_codon:yes gene_type:complete
MKPVKLSLTQLKRFMSLLHLERASEDTIVKMTINDEVVIDLIKNNCVDKVDGAMVINSKGISEIERLSRISGLDRA